MKSIEEKEEAKSNLRADDLDSTIQHIKDRPDSENNKQQDHIILQDQVKYHVYHDNKKITNSDMQPEKSIQLKGLADSNSTGDVQEDQMTKEKL